MKDMRNRVKFAKKMQREYSADVWTKQIRFYLDSVAFAYKRNPLDQGKAPEARIWRKKSEGLEIRCVAKGRKEGTGGKVVKFIVAISYDKGVICCEPYERMCGHFFATFIKMNFTRLFTKADKGTNRLWIQDGDPPQNSEMARSAMRSANSTLIKSQSPDLNCIENLFPIVRRILKKQALERGIKRESFNQFKAHAKAAILSIPVRTINHIIGSIHKRMSLVITNKGRRLNYKVTRLLFMK